MLYNYLYNISYNFKMKALDMLSVVVREAGFYESEQAAEMIYNILETIRQLD